MNFLTAILAALFEALLPFLKQQASAPVERTVAQDDPAIEQEVTDAIDQYDSDHHAPSD
jgi:hypothetical protein